MDKCFGSSGANSQEDYGATNNKPKMKIKIAKILTQNNLILPTIDVRNELNKPFIRVFFLLAFFFVFLVLSFLSFLSFFVFFIIFIISSFLFFLK